jgi:hypothetical protein
MMGDARGGDDVFSHVALPLSQATRDNGDGTRWFHAMWAGGEAPERAKIGQIPHFWPAFGLVCLDSRLRAAISPPIPARDFSRRLFLRRIRC